MNPTNNSLVIKANNYRHGWIHAACVSSVSGIIEVPRASTSAGLGFSVSDCRYYVDILDQRIQASIVIKTAVRTDFDNASFQLQVASGSRNPGAVKKAKEIRQDYFDELSGWTDWINRLNHVRSALVLHIESNTIKLPPVAVKPVAVLEVEKVDPDQLRKFGSHGKAKRTTARGETSLNSRETDNPFQMLKELIAEAA